MIRSARQIRTVREPGRIAAQHRRHRQRSRQRARHDAAPRALLGSRARRYRRPETVSFRGGERAEGPCVLSIKSVDERRLREVALTPDEYKAIVEQLKRAPNEVERCMP